jgi:hypothetical protein
MRTAQLSGPGSTDLGATYGAPHRETRSPGQAPPPESSALGEPRVRAAAQRPPVPPCSDELRPGSGFSRRSHHRLRSGSDGNRGDRGDWGDWGDLS